MRQGIEGTMLCRILKTRIKHRYFTRGKSFESGTSLAASCAHELRYQTAKSCAFFFLERRKFEERTRWKRRVSKTLVLCRGRFRSGSVPNPQNQSDLQSKVSNRFWTPCAKCNACAKCKELGAQIRGWCTFSRLHLTGEFCLRISIRWRSMVRCTFSRVRIFAGTPVCMQATRWIVLRTAKKKKKKKKKNNYDRYVFSDKSVFFVTKKKKSNARSDPSHFASDLKTSWLYCSLIWNMLILVDHACHSSERVVSRLEGP